MTSPRRCCKHQRKQEPRDIQIMNLRTLHLVKCMLVGLNTKSETWLPCGKYLGFSPGKYVSTSLLHWFCGNLTDPRERKNWTDTITSNWEEFKSYQGAELIQISFCSPILYQFQLVRPFFLLSTREHAAQRLP